MADRTPPTTPRHDARGELLREFLALGDQRCPSCNHQLHQLTGTACPKCRETLVLRVGWKRSRHSALKVALIGLAVPIGFGGFILFMLFLASTIGGSSIPSNNFSVYVLIVMYGLLLIGWFWFGRRLRRLNTRPRA